MRSSRIYFSGGQRRLHVTEEAAKIKKEIGQCWRTEKNEYLILLGPYHKDVTDTWNARILHSNGDIDENLINELELSELFTNTREIAALKAAIGRRERANTELSQFLRKIKDMPR